MSIDGIVNAYKPSGITSKDFVDIFKKKYNVKKACFCGRLDPLARGKMIILCDEKCKLMPQTNGNNKIYQFEILFGLQTDSDDFMGLLINKNFDNIIFQEKLYKLKSELERNYINKNVEYYQNFHRYSSINIKGKPYWMYTKNNEVVEDIPNHLIKIYDIKIINIFERNLDEVIKINNLYINQIDKKHDFRQEEIIKQWNEFRFSNIKLPTFKIEANVSSGFYVRQFVQELSAKIDFPLLALDIHRVSI
tara:strand:- start:657 stop:1403 length:747 start_codon:yes stop_codon:yes gene_type:complete